MRLRVGARSQIFLCGHLPGRDTPLKVKSLQEIEAALRPIAAAQGVELYEVVFRQGKHPSLTVFLDTDREGGIDLDACERFHNAADAALDELDPTFGQPYTLNVSSPGLDRPFKKDSDFQKNLGKKVEIKLFAPIRGEKFFEAVLLAYDGAAANITVQKGDEVLKLNLSQIVKISQAIEFD